MIVLLPSSSLSVGGICLIDGGNGTFLFRLPSWWGLILGLKKHTLGLDLPSTYRELFSLSVLDNLNPNYAHPIPKPWESSCVPQSDSTLGFDVEVIYFPLDCLDPFSLGPPISVES